MEPDDQRLADSLKLAYEQGLEVLFVPKNEKAEHPNMVKMILKGDRKMSVTGISIGGGNIQISELNGFKISLTLGTLPMSSFIKMFPEWSHVSRIYFLRHKSILVR